MDYYLDFFDSDPIHTIYFGGGTPSLLSVAELQQIYDAIAQRWNVSAVEEFTIECNPDDLTDEYLLQLRSLPINRLSIGVQSFCDDELRWLNRRHTAAEAIEAVKEARAHGDLSENFEYYAAKRDKNKNESRIRYLERMLKTATVIDDSSKDDEVGMNNTVTVYFEDEDEEETYRIVTTVRENVLEGLISIESPIGKAIMGHKVGDRVYVDINGKNGYYVVIRNIENTTDDSNDRIKKF
jgi:transcription elongation factor GreA